MKFYCPHALADGNQHIRIREKTLEFSSTVLAKLSAYHIKLNLNKNMLRVHNTTTTLHCKSYVIQKSLKMCGFVSLFD